MGGGLYVPHGGTEKHDAFRTLHKLVGMTGAKVPWGKGKRRDARPCVLNQGV